MSSSETQFSNFWMPKLSEENGFDNHYLSIYKRESLGCFKVYGVRDSYLLDLSDQNIKYLFEIENFEIQDHDSWISYYARMIGILMHVCNRETFGYIPDIVDNAEEIADSFNHLKIEHLTKGPNKTYNSPLPISKHIKDYAQEKLTLAKTKLGFDEIYVINLERRSDRREVIKTTLDYLGVSFKLVKAVDGTTINDEYIKGLAINVLPGYKDPYNDRTMNYGEIGCFLSHYFIWKEVIN